VGDNAVGQESGGVAGERETGEAMDSRGNGVYISGGVLLIIIILLLIWLL
jgi:hypothetical protein